MKTDAARYAEIREWMKAHLIEVVAKRSPIETPEYLSLWAESEKIKNRNGGMPPGSVAASQIF
jgi:hypothetical protein